MSKFISKLVLPLGLLLVGLGHWAPAMAKERGFFGGYNLGLSYDTTTRYAQVSYDSPHQPTLPADCESSVKSRALMNCTAYLAPDGGSFSPSLFIEEPFIRQGLFYFEPGFGAATLSYQGVLNSKPKPLAQGGTVSTKGLPSKLVGEQPLQQARMELYGINVHATLRIGVTPYYFPDLMLTSGLGLQMVAGKVTVFTKTSQTMLIQPDGFVEGEVVFVRYREGYLSFYLGQDQSLSRSLSSKLIEDYPSGSSLSDFKLTLVGAASGLRLLFLW